VKSFPRSGLKEGLRILGKIKAELKLPILTDIHDASQAAPAAEVADVLQIPAFWRGKRICWWRRVRLAA